MVAGGGHIHTYLSKRTKALTSPGWAGKVDVEKEMKGIRRV